MMPKGLSNTSLSLAAQRWWRAQREIVCDFFFFSSFFSFLSVLLTSLSAKQHDSCSGACDPSLHNFTIAATKTVCGNKE